MRRAQLSGWTRPVLLCDDQPSLINWRRRGPMNCSDENYVSRYLFFSIRGNRSADKLRDRVEFWQKYSMIYILKLPGLLTSWLCQLLSRMITDSPYHVCVLIPISTLFAQLGQFLIERISWSSIIFILTDTGVNRYI